MRNLTRFLAMALTILMIAGCFSVAALAYADGPFVNYDDEIAIMSEMGLLKGYAGTDNFGYGNNITRREACILFARVLTGRTDAEYAAANFMGDVNNTGFADLDATGDFYGAINLAKNENLIIGYTEDGVEKFNPNGTITYQDFLTICVRLLYSSFDDTETIEKLNAGYDVILDIETQGAEQILSKRPDAVSIFVFPPSFEILEQRLRSRGTDSEEKILGRLAQARVECKKAKMYNYLIINDKIETACDEMMAIITAEKCRTAERLYHLDVD